MHHRCSFARKARKALLPSLPRPDQSIPVERYPEYPEACIELTEECRQDCLLPTHIANVSSITTYPLIGAEKQALNSSEICETFEVCHLQYENV